MTIQTKLGDFSRPWFMQLVNAAKQVPITRTEVGSSLLDTARNPIIRNKTPSPDLPGSKSREKGTKSESIAENTATPSRNIIFHVHCLFSHFGRRNRFHVCSVFTRPFPSSCIP